MLGHRIKELRGQQGLTQGQVAEYSGLTRSYISLLEIGQISHPSAEKLIRLARALHVNPETLFLAAGYVAEEQAPDLPDFYTYVSRKFSDNPRMQRALIGTYEAVRPED
jgi:transcriptional regulator with XRE-family HTH domain